MQMSPVRTLASRPAMRCRLPAALVLLLAVAAPAQGTGIERSPANSRDYRALLLDNGLEALVVSDPDADKAAAALDVNVGNANDPDARPGLAHFLEHVLFLGTEKFPDPDEYRRFVAEHGGSTNATTSFAHTRYFFDVDAAHLEGALDRFAQFFISPRFDPAYVDRERQVVHSEFVSRRRGDRNRSYAAWKEAINPDHPLSRFHVGSTETLADRPDGGIRDEMIAFYESAYSSHLMKLVVVGREPLDTLERLVRLRFEQVERRDVERLRVEAPLYRDGTLPARLEVEPVRDLRTISLSFAIPPLRPHYRSHPLVLVSHLLGHEGKGSLLSALKAQGWAEGLSAGPGFAHPDFASFRVTIQATEAGIAHTDAMVAAVFAYLDLIGREGIEPRFHDEIARMAEINFRYQETPEPRSHATSLASALHVYPVHEVLTVPYLFDEFDPALERRFLSLLTPERVLVTVVATGVPTDAVAPYHETPYRLSPIPPGTVERWRNPAADSTFALPEPNPFVPGELALINVPPGVPHPVRIVQRPGFELWHQADTEFEQPRANFYFSVRSPITNDSPRHAVLSSLLTRMSNDALNEFTYTAALSGHSYSLYSHRRGISVRLSGWSDQQGRLLERIVSTLRAPPLSAQRFEAEKTEYERTLGNVRERPPNHRAISAVRRLLVDPEWPAPVRLAALEEVELEDLQEYVRRFYERGEIVALAHGNLTAESAKTLGGVLERELLASMEPLPVTPGRVVRLEPGVRYARWLTSDHEDHALAVYLQGHQRGVAARAMMGLIAQAIENRFFHELRTEREIGYIVFATLMPLLEVPGLVLVVQSPNTPPERLHREVDAFLQRTGDVLRDMPDAEFERHRATVESALLEADTRLDDRTGRYWYEIDREHFDFDWREQLLAALRGITREEVAQAWRDIVTAPDTSRRVIVAVSGQQPAALDGPLGDTQPVANAGEFKRHQQYFDAL